jgi:anti-sigma factor ChrR (cupin superfamily)
MNEAQLALYLRGDLSIADHRTVAVHVDVCSTCQSTLEDLSRSHELLVGSFEEPTPAELSAVRSAVAARIQTRRRGPAWRIWTFAASAVTAVIILLANLPLQTQAPRPPMAPKVPPPAIKISPPPLAARIMPRRRVAPAARTVTLLTRAEQPAFLKINTPDPNVVILWQLNDNEKAETP